MGVQTVAAIAATPKTSADIATARRIVNWVRLLRIALRMIRSAVASSMSKMWQGMLIGMVPIPFRVRVRLK